MNIPVSRAEDYERFVEETAAAFPEHIEFVGNHLASAGAAELAEAGSMHADGFIKVPIGPEDGINDGQLRIHLWLPNRQRTGEPHSHPWHLGSYVMHGVYVEELPQIVPDPDGLFEVHTVTYGESSDDRDAVMAGERARIEDAEIAEYPAGSYHWIPSRIHHRTYDSGGMVTVAAMSPRFENFSQFVAMGAGDFDPTISDEDIDAADQLLRDAI